MNEGTKRAASGRDKILDNSNAMMGKVIDLLKLKPELDKSNNSEAGKDSKPETGIGGNGETGKDNKPEIGKPATPGESGTTSGDKPAAGTGGNSEAGKDSKPETESPATSGESGKADDKKTDNRNR